MDITDSSYEYERVLLEKDEHTQVRLTVHNFRGKEYLGIREYYQDFEETWHPGSKGINLELGMEVTQCLFSALLDILSMAESKELIEEHFKELIDELYSN